VEQEKTLLELVNQWLERMPFFEESRFWKNYKSIANGVAESANFLE
jgi:tryptophan 2,3-dioxygenase